MTTTATTAAAACCSVCSYLSLLSAVAIAHLNSNTHAYTQRDSQTLTPASQAIISKQLHSKMHSVCASVKPYTLAHPIHMTVLHNHFEWNTLTRDTSIQWQSIETKRTNEQMNEEKSSVLYID